jgi:hypothetical protein
MAEKKSLFIEWLQEQRKEKQGRKGVGTSLAEELDPKEKKRNQRSRLRLRSRLENATI